VLPTKRHCDDDGFVLAVVVGIVVVFWMEMKLESMRPLPR